MEVDYLGKAYDKGKKGGKKGKDKGKAKGKDKGKPKEGKGLWKSSDKGRSMWEKGPGKKGKNPSPKGGKSGACHVCGKMGHFAKDCWKRVKIWKSRPQILADLVHLQLGKLEVLHRRSMPL